MKTLPCFPCPHSSACCSYGTSLSKSEANEIISNFGDDKVIDEDGDLRTNVVDGKCIFLINNACSIHNTKYYPRVCAGFPWIDAEYGGPYEGDEDICPELK